MISKVIYTRNLAATLNYILNPKKDGEVALARKVSSLVNVDAIIRDFEMQSQLRPSVEVKAVHIILSFHTDDTEKLEAHYEEILKDWIELLKTKGYRFDQYVVGRHHDQDHKNPHFHLLANVILDNGKRATLACIGRNAKKCSMEITERWGLTPANHKKLAKQTENHKTEQGNSMLSPSHCHGIATSQTKPKNNDFGGKGVNVSSTRTMAESSHSPDFIGAMAELIAPSEIVTSSVGGCDNNSLDNDDWKDWKPKPNAKFIKPKYGARKGGRR